MQENYLCETPYFTTLLTRNNRKSDYVCHSERSEESHEKDLCVFRTGSSLKLRMTALFGTFSGAIWVTAKKITNSVE